MPRCFTSEPVISEHLTIKANIHLFTLRRELALGRRKSLLNEKRQVLRSDLECFHRVDVTTDVKESLKLLLPQAPTLAGRTRLSVLNQRRPRTIFIKTLLVETEEVPDLREAKTVLFHLDDALAERLGRRLLVDHEVKVNVDVVLDLLLPGELPVLVHLADDDRRRERLLAELGDHFRHPDRCHAVRATVGVEAVVVGLEGVDDEEKRLARVLGDESASMLQDSRNETILTDDEAVLQLQALRRLSRLHPGLLLPVDEADVPLRHPTVGDLLSAGALARSWRTSKENGRGGGDTLLLITRAEQVIDPRDSARDAGLQARVDLQVKDVRPLLETRLWEIHRTVVALGFALVRHLHSSVVSPLYLGLSCDSHSHRAPRGWALRLRSAPRTSRQDTVPHTQKENTS